MSGPSEAEVVRRMFAGDPVAQRLGVELVDVEPNQVTVQMKVDDRHLGGHALCHGGVLFTLADVLMSYVSNRSNLQAVATHASIDFIDAIRQGDVIEAIGVESNLRGRAAVCDVTMRVDDKIVGLFRGNTLRTTGLVTDLY